MSLDKNLYEKIWYKGKHKKGDKVKALKPKEKNLPGKKKEEKKRKV